jgi:hypothetical protein
MGQLSTVLVAIGWWAQTELAPSLPANICFQTSVIELGNYFCNANTETCWAQKEARMHTGEREFEETKGRTPQVKEEKTFAHSRPCPTSSGSSGDQGTANGNIVPIELILLLCCRVYGIVLRWQEREQSKQRVCSQLHQ